MFQLSLQFSNNRENLAEQLRKLTGKTVSVNLTDNSTSMLSVRSRGKAAFVRMHWMFLNGGQDVIREIADFIKIGRGSGLLVRKFISENRACLKKREIRSAKAALRSQGRFYDLAGIFHELNNEYFEGGVTALIGWGKQNIRRSVKKRTLGSYNRQTNTVWISPALDRRNVPKYFVRFVVYHEMLHSVVKEERKKCRRVVHTPEFRKREQLFKDYDKAVSWENKH